MRKKVSAKATEKDMTIRRSLAASNGLMIAIFVAIAVLIAAAFLITAWFWGLKDRYSDSDETRDNFAVCEEIISHTSEAIASSGEGTESAKFGAVIFELADTLEEKEFRLLIRSEKGNSYSYGKIEAEDIILADTIRAMGGSGFIYERNRQLYAETIVSGDENYEICIYINQPSYIIRKLVTITIVTISLLVVEIIVAIVVINKFFAKFVFKRIEEPLDKLSYGVHKIQDGDYDYRIEYDTDDEFRPICEDFNEMAVRLKFSVEQLAKQEENRKELLVSISHDLRSPLTSVSAYTDGLIEGVAKTEEAKRKYLKIIKQKTTDMINLVSKLFMFSKMELNEYPTIPEVIRLDKEVKELVDAIAADYKDKGLEIEIKEMTESFIFADPEQLHCVLVNIIDNAWKYKKNEVGHLEISLKEFGNRYILSFKDDGPGVSEESLSKLFEVFYRSDQARRNPGGSSGIGLAITFNAVKRMKGSIHAENVQPNGLNIIIILPKTEKENE